MAQVAAAGGAPFVSAIEADPLQNPMHDQNPLIRQAWTALQALPAARYLGLATVRFLLRMPYGRRSDPIDAFKFEEFTREAGLSGMLWANPAVAAGLLLAQGWGKAGAKMTPGTPSVIGEMAYYVYTPPDGDQVALPCTERLWSRAPGGRCLRLPRHARGQPCVAGRRCAWRAWRRSPGRCWPGRGRPWRSRFRHPPVPTASPAEHPTPEPVAAVPVPAVPEPMSGSVEAIAGAEEAVDLDALLASLDTGEPASPKKRHPSPPFPSQRPRRRWTSIALLASLSAEPPPAAEGETEVDLDALLASL